MTTFIMIVVLCYIFAIVAQGISDKEYDKYKQRSNKQLPSNLYSWGAGDSSGVGDDNMKKAKSSSTKSPGHVFDFEDKVGEEQPPTKDSTIDGKEWELLPLTEEFIDDDDIPF